MKISLAKEPLLTVFTWYCSNCLITFGYFNVLTKTQFQMCNFKNYFTLLCMSITAKEMNSGQKLIMTVITFAPNWWRKNSLSKTKIESADNNEHWGRRSLRGTGGRLTPAPHILVLVVEGKLILSNDPLSLPSGPPYILTFRRLWLAYVPNGSVQMNWSLMELGFDQSNSFQS